MTWAKNVGRRYYFYPGPRYYNDEIIIKTKAYFHTDEKLFELGCIKNDFAKYFAKLCNLTIVSYCTLW